MDNKIYFVFVTEIHDCNFNTELRNYMKCLSPLLDSKTDEDRDHVYFFVHLTQAVLPLASTLEQSSILASEILLGPFSVKPLFAPLRSFCEV